MKWISTWRTKYRFLLYVPTYFWFYVFTIHSKNFNKIRCDKSGKTVYVCLHFIQVILFQKLWFLHQVSQNVIQFRGVLTGYQKLGGKVVMRRAFYVAQPTLPTCQLRPCNAIITYRTRVIISRGLYTFYPIFHCGL